MVTMMTSDWASSENRLRDAARAMPAPSRDRGIGEAVSLAYGKVATDIPDDLMRLLAKLN
jgi:hypothetical protein